MKVLSLVSVLFLAAPALTAMAAPAKSLSAEQAAVLTEIKAKTIDYVENQKVEAEKLRRCFALPSSCSPELLSKLPKIRKAIQQKTEEYRLLVGLSQIDEIKNTRSASLSLNIPRTHYGPRSYQESPELEMIYALHQKDSTAIIEKAKKITQGQDSVYASLTGYAMINEQKTAKVFYEKQALMLIHQIPFIIYIDTDRVTDATITKALGKYLRQINIAMNDLYDETSNPLETFLIYQPLVKEVADSSVQKKKVLEQLLEQQRHGVGLKAWIERNKPSLTMAAFSTCSLVAATLQAWPVSLACGGALTVITVKQLYGDFFRMKDNFALWLVGAQSQQALRDSEARVLYSTMALFFAGQGVASTLASIESGLIATLNTLPSLAAARFTSLAALREGGLRFVTRTIEFKGKDLGASILAGSYDDITDPNLKTTRMDRLFTYQDFLKLQEI